MAFFSTFLFLAAQAVAPDVGNQGPKIELMLDGARSDDVEPERVRTTLGALDWSACAQTVADTGDFPARAVLQVRLEAGSVVKASLKEGTLPRKTAACLARTLKAKRPLFRGPVAGRIELTFVATRIEPPTPTPPDPPGEPQADQDEPADDADVAPAETRVCAPGASQLCYCPSGSKGAQVCEDSGRRWGACTCAADEDSRVEARKKKRKARRAKKRDRRRRASKRKVVTERHVPNPSFFPRFFPWSTDPSLPRPVEEVSTLTHVLGPVLWGAFWVPLLLIDDPDQPPLTTDQFVSVLVPGATALAVAMVGTIGAPLAGGSVLLVSFLAAATQQSAGGANAFAAGGCICGGLTTVALFVLSQLTWIILAFRVAPTASLNAWGRAYRRQGRRAEIQLDTPRPQRRTAMSF